MDKAYIILAHKNLNQVLRLLNALNNQAAYFFVHVDKKVPREEVMQLYEFTGNLHILERIDTKWAEFSLVQATLMGMKAVKATGKKFEMISLLSGQDYPVKCNELIDAFYAATDKRVFIEYHTLPDYNKWVDGGGMYRVTKYFLGLKTYQRYSAKVANFLATLLPVFKRNRPQNMIPYAGSQWWTIDSYALDYILDHVRSNPAYSLYHKHTFASDEVFFQTILLNAKDKKLSESILNNNKRFIVWESAAASHPEILTGENLQGLILSDAFFARKLDLHHNAELFDAVDKACLKHAANQVITPR